MTTMSLMISVQKFNLLLSNKIHEFLYVQLSQEISMLVAQDGGKMILLPQQVH